MTDKKYVSRLSDHKLKKKKGVVATPLNDGLGDILKTTSWPKERMPEYLWLGLILQYYGRKEGFEKSFQILHEISQRVISLSRPRLSMILNLSDNEQRIVYDIICKVIDKKIISPLTVIYRRAAYPIFNEYFFTPQLQVKDRIDILSKAIKTYFPPQSFEATDLRFLAIVLMLFTGRMKFPAHLAEDAKFLQEYPCTDHRDEKMKSYRPSVRCMEGMVFDENVEFSLRFWRDIGMLTPCNPVVIKFDENPEDYSRFIIDCRKVLEYVLVANKEKSLADDKFNVITGLITYATKIFVEIDNKSLGNSILGRHGIRTIIEIYITLKYLLKKEAEKPNIWKEYKSYGIGKYKLVLLKARETELDKDSHFILPVADVIVNETVFEEFIDIDLKYFDKQGIREKSIEVGEKDLYDLLYDYDSSFSHGLWGAIRESAMFHCDNASHQYHCIPDIYSGQKLPDVKSDSIKIMKKIFLLLSDIFEIQEDFLCKYGIK
jgi:hypothetical protein